MYGDTNPGIANDPNGGLYGAGRFAYSINQFSSSLNATASGSALWSMVDYDAELSASVAAGNISYMTVTGPARFDAKGVRAFVLESGSNFTNVELLPQYTSTNGTAITFVYDKASSNFGANANGATLYYNVQPADNYRGDFEDNSGAGYPNAESTAADALAIPQINIQMKRK